MQNGVGSLDKKCSIYTGLGFSLLVVVLIFVRRSWTVEGFGDGSEAGD